MFLHYTLQNTVILRQLKLVAYGQECETAVVTMLKIRISTFPSLRESPLC